MLRAGAREPLLHAGIALCRGLADARDAAGPCKGFTGGRRRSLRQGVPSTGGLRVAEDRHACWLYQRHRAQVDVQPRGRDQTVDVVRSTRFCETEQGSERHTWVGTYDLAEGLSRTV